MKLVYILPILAIATLIFSSCKNKQCKVCTTSTTQTVMGFDQTTNVNSEYCGDDYENAPANNTVTQDIGGGVMQTVSINCTDK